MLEYRVLIYLDKNILVIYDDVDGANETLLTQTEPFRTINKQSGVAALVRVRTSSAQFYMSVSQWHLFNHRADDRGKY